MSSRENVCERCNDFFNGIDSENYCLLCKQYNEVKAKLADAVEALRYYALGKNNGKSFGDSVIAKECLARLGQKESG